MRLVDRRGPARPASGPGGRRFRADIQGLRAVAVAGVVLYHAHVGLLSGGYVGVDVFFVISGYLITEHLWRELDGKGRISFSAFYGRRIRRLLPAAMLVLVVTMAASAIWLPPLQTRSVWKDGLASALYVGNYRFALTQTDYLASNLASPFQHYWSLGVEEQFYLLWPLLLVGVALAWRRRPPSAAGAVAGLAALGAGSFAFSLWLTRTDEPWAFFSLPSRAWELAAGGLVALVAPWIRRHVARPVAALVGWVGLGAIVWSMLAFTASTAFPGTAALAPVLGTAAVIAAGTARPAAGPVLALRLAGMQRIGAVSYSLYLWHWPVLVLAPDVVGHALAWWEYLLLALGSGVPAMLTYRLVERPAQRSRWLAGDPARSFVLAGSLSAAGVAACVLAVTTLPPIAGHGRAPIAVVRVPSTTTPEVSPHRRPVPAADPARVALDAAQAQVEAAVTRSTSVATVPANLDPSLGDASASEAAPFVDGCLLSFESTAQPPCVFGDTTSSQSMVLFGDSHATMWFPALDSYANEQHLSLRVFTKATCPPIDLSIFTPELGREFSECDEWKSEVLATIASSRPKLVVLGIAPNYDLAYQVIQDGPAWLRGLSEMVAAIRHDGSRVVVMGPVPSPNFYVADCLSAHLGDMQACATPSTGGADGNGLVGYDTAGMTAEAATVTAAGGYFVDVKPWFCAGATCPPVVDNLLVYRDNSHITVPYAAYLAPLVADELRIAVSSPSTSAPPSSTGSKP
jgi:peptidoglycan/LPS O-acetylase OafA/YrhL